MNEEKPIDLVSAALVEAQGKLKAAQMDATNPFFKSKYATLGAIIEASRDALYNAGIMIQQSIDIRDGMVTVGTIIRHKSGQWINGGSMTLPLGENDRNSDAQVAGSICTYLKRYSWASNLGIYADQDDDGNSAPKGAIKPPGAVARPKDTAQPQQMASSTQTDHKSATIQHRMKALNNLFGAPGQVNRGLVSSFLRSKGWIGMKEEPESWVLERVPTTLEGMQAISKEVGEFERTQREQVQP